MNKIKQNKGITGIDITISIIIITIFIALISTLVYKITYNSTKIDRKNTAVSYAIDEIEKIKEQGYVSDYDDLGLEKEVTMENYSEDIKENGEFSGYHKEITIEDYVALEGNETKLPNILKKITVKISFKLGNEEITIPISTYIAKE